MSGAYAQGRSWNGDNPNTIYRQGGKHGIIQWLLKQQTETSYSSGIYYLPNLLTIVHIMNAINPVKTSIGHIQGGG